MRSWYKFINKAETGAEILLYEPIGRWDIPAVRLINEVKAAGDIAQITLRINSPGGEVFDSLAIYNYLLQHSARIDVVVDGLAASGASIVAMAGDSIRMPENALMMIHNPMGIAIGSAKEMRDLADLLDKMQTSLISIYAARTGLDADTLGEMLDAETWMTGPEALEKGFATAVTESVDMAAVAGFNLSRYNKAPTIKRSHTPEDRSMNEDQLKRLRAALGLGESADAEAIITAVAASQQDAGAVAAIAEALGADAGAETQTIVAAARTAREQSQRVAETGLTPEQIAELQAGASELREIRAERLVEAATKAGKIVASNRAWAMEEARERPDAFKRWEASAPSIVPTNKKTAASAGGATAATVDPDLGPSDEQVKALAQREDIRREAKAMGLSPEAYAKHNYNELIEAA